MEYQIRAEWMGLTPFSSADLYQKKLAAGLDVDVQVLGLEHHPTITLGLRAQDETDLMIHPSRLHDLGVQLERIDRGGQATLHAPGQLVIYPVASLRRLGLGARTWVSLLQTVTQQTLADFGVRSQCRNGETGLFTDRGKIAFFGLRISGGVSRHGLSINVSNDLSQFKWIRSCGEFNARLDRLSEYNIEVELSELFYKWFDHFQTILQKDRSRLNTCSADKNDKPNLPDPAQEQFESDVLR